LSHCIRINFHGLGQANLPSGEASTALLAPVNDTIASRFAAILIADS
jgi:hypothetical protein